MLQPSTGTALPANVPKLLTQNTFIPLRVNDFLVRVGSTLVRNLSLKCLRKKSEAGEAPRVAVMDFPEMIDARPTTSVILVA